MNTNDIKINVLISLPGSSKYTTKETIKTTVDDNGNVTTAVDYSMYDHHSMMLKEENNKENLYHYHTLKAKPAQQSINMCTEAYKAMIDANEVPWWSNASDWKHYNKTQRLEKHLKRIAESLGGTVLNYEVFED